MLLSDLQRKDIVNIKDGKKLGKIIDVEISKDGKVESILTSGGKVIKNFFNPEKESRVRFDDIKSMGEDVILVDTTWITSFFLI